MREQEAIALLWEGLVACEGILEVREILRTGQSETDIQETLERRGLISSDFQEHKIRAKTAAEFLVSEYDDVDSRYYE